MKLGFQVLLPLKLQTTSSQAGCLCQRDPDASIASILDSTPPIERPEPEFWKQKSWGKLSESISRGVTAKLGQENVNVVGLSGTGSLKAYSRTNQYDITDIDNFSFTF